jgi:conjugative relaxase-like TrwC/TraI family protein
MISKSDIQSAAGTSKYMTAQATTEYYAGQAVPSAWHGNGAEIQGLAGREVTTQELTAQLEGRVQNLNEKTGQFEEKQLGRMEMNKETGEKELQHRAGWDFTFAPPKSVSIESEVFGNADVRAAHESAVLETMKWLETHAAQARVNGQTVNTGNLTYATFQHAITREGDPQTHTHVVIANVTHVGGKAYSLSNEKLFQYRTTADAVYQNRLANELEKLGYNCEWQRDGKNQSFEISGYTKENLDTFSKRNEAIKEALAKRGLDKDSASFEARQAATLDSRRDKDQPENAAAHRDGWQKEAEAAGIKQVEREPLAGDKHIRELNQIDAARDAVQSSMNHLTEREMAFSEKDLWKHAAQFAQGGTDTDKISQAIHEQQKSGNLILRDDGKYTTREAVGAEKWMENHLRDGYGAHHATMSNKEFEAALAKFEARKTAEFGKEFKLNDGQREAARMVLTTDNKWMGIQGLAGTGKTTLFEFVREAAESKNCQVIGVSNGGAQADKLQMESGIKSQTVASFVIEANKTIKDADLAQRAIDTHEKHSGVFGRQPDFKALAAGVNTGDVTRERDSTGREYFTDRAGETWTKGLYEKTTQTSSANLNHLGLTDTKYVVTDKGVFKSGGDLASELGGALRDKYNETQRDTSTVMGKAQDAVASNWLKNAENWQKCNVVEATAVRAQCAVETKSNQSAELGALKEQAALANGQAKEVKLVMDEASMSGQREFNQVINAAEKLGYQVAFSGDKLQHQSVDAGRAFENAQNAMPMRELTEIQRQTTQHTKETVAAIVDGKHEEAARGIATKEISPNQDAVREKYERIENPTAKEERAFKAELKEAAKADNKEVITTLAKDYAAMPKESRKIEVDMKGKEEGKDYSVMRNDKGEAERITFHKEDKELGIKAGESGTIPKGGEKDGVANVKMDSQNSTIVITATNADRQAINSEIRDNLKAQGELKDGVKMNTLQSADRTGEEMKRATSFEKGQVVEFTSKLKSLDVDKGERGTVTAADSKTNTVSLKMEDGREIKFNPEKIEGKQLYNENKGKEFAPGDRVAIGSNGKDSQDRDVKNGQIGKIEKINDKSVTLKMENGEKHEFNTQEYKHLDHAYAVTSQKSQGQSVDVAFKHHNTEGGRHGDREAYVNDTRAKTHEVAYTQNAEKAAVQSGQKMDKESAIVREPAAEKQSSASAERSGSVKSEATSSKISTSSKVEAKEAKNERSEGKGNSSTPSASRDRDTGAGR